MLWLLSVAAKRGFVVESYRDKPVGLMGKDASGNLAMTFVTVRANILFAGEQRPAKEQVIAMHEEAHGRCFIANSVRTEVRCEPVLTTAGAIP